MRRYVFIICFLTTSMFSFLMKPEMNVKSAKLKEDNAAVETVRFMIDDEKIKEHYNKAVKVSIQIPQGIYCDDMEVSIIHEGEVKKLHEELSWILVEDIYCSIYDVTEEGENYYIQVKNTNLSEPLLINSSKFSIDLTKPLLQFRIADDDITNREGIQIFEEATEMIIRLNDSTLHEEHSYLLINEEKRAVDWVKTEPSYLGSYSFEDEGIYKIFYHIEDMAGNVSEATASFQILIDKTAPQVAVKANQQRIDHTFADYYNKDMTLEVTVKDVQLNMERSFISINGVKEELLWIVKDSMFMVQKTLSDGFYQISYHMEDMAGHISERISEEKFSIDTMKPTMQVESNAQDFQNQNVKMNVHIEEKNLKDIQILYKVNQQVVEFIPKWISGEGVYDTVLLFDKEGAHDVAITSTDMAGNINTTEAYHFVIDKKAPDLQIEMNHMQAREQLQYVINKDVKLQIKVDDTYLKSRSIELYKNDQLMQRQYEKNQITWLIEAEKNKLNTYMIKVSADDDAGNQSAKTVTFAIQTHIEPIKIANDVFRNKPLSDSWLPKIKGESSGLHVLDCTLQRNRQKVPYTWGQEIVEDGDYVLDLMVINDAMRYARLASPFYFTIDKTAPVLELSRLKTREEVLTEIGKNEYLQLRIVQTDSVKKEQENFVSIQVNGQTIGYLKEVNKEKIFTYLPTHTGMYIIEASAKDEAGNEVKQNWKISVVDHPVKIKPKETPSPVRQIEDKGKLLWCVLPLIAGVIFFRYLCYGQRRK